MIHPASRVLEWRVIAYSVPGCLQVSGGGLWLRMLPCGCWAFISTAFYPASRPAHSAHVCSASLSHKPVAICLLPARAHRHSRHETAETPSALLRPSLWEDNQPLPLHGKPWSWSFMHREHLQRHGELGKAGGTLQSQAALSLLPCLCCAGGSASVENRKTNLLGSWHQVMLTWGISRSLSGWRKGLHCRGPCSSTSIGLR